MGAQPTEPGWYNDPDGLHPHQAYWDGEKWTGETRRGRKDQTRRDYRKSSSKRRNNRKSLDLEEVSVSSYVVNLIAAVLLAVIVAVIAGSVLAAVGFAMATMPETKLTPKAELEMLGIVGITFLATGLIYYGMFRKLRKLKPRKRT